MYWFSGDRVLGSVSLVVGVTLAAIPAADARCSPKSPFRVAIDIGHSPALPGATSASGRTEYEFNKRFAEELVAEGKARKSLAL